MYDGESQKSKHNANFNKIFTLVLIISVVSKFCFFEIPKMGCWCTYSIVDVIVVDTLAFLAADVDVSASC